MTTVALIHQAFDKGKTDVRDGAERLRKDRDDIDRRVTAFLGAGWTGVAADSFVDAWDDWKSGATDVLEGLAAMGELLDAAHRDFISADGESQQHLDTIAARIVERLG